MDMSERVIRVYVAVVWYLQMSARRLMEGHGRRISKPQRAAAMVEYAVLAALIVVGTIAATEALGASIGGVFDRIRSRINGLG